MPPMPAEELPAWSEPFAGDPGSRLTRLPTLAGIDRAWAWGQSTGRGVTVAIIDSGVETEHPAVRGRVVESLAVRLAPEGPEIVEDDAGDLFGHGTACAGIIVGLAPEVEIVSIRVLGADLKGKGEAFAAALGAGLWIASLNVRYRDFRYIVPFVVQMGLYISPVGFSSSIVPEKWRLLYSLNPMVGVIDGFRWAILGGNYRIYWPGFALSLAVVSVLLAGGIYYFRRTEKTFADVI